MLGLVRGVVLPCPVPVGQMITLFFLPLFLSLQQLLLPPPCSILLGRVGRKEMKKDKKSGFSNMSSELLLYLERHSLVFDYTLFIQFTMWTVYSSLIFIKAFLALLYSGSAIERIV